MKTRLVKGRVSLGSILGIPMFLHWTFLLMLLGFFGFYLWQGASVMAALVGVGFISTLFGCVMLHELGHAFMARRYGIATADITLYPIGGVARLTRMPTKPVQELWIALAGPAVNAVIATGLFLLVGAFGGPMALDATLARPTELLSMLMWANIGLVGFNMLPAFPMDGGRVLRAGLATQMTFVRATHIAAFVGQVMAFLFAVWAIISFNPVLLFIAVFVFGAARQEVRNVTQT